MTTSCTPSVVGSSDAFTSALNAASPTRSVRPLALTASRCGPRITQETSCPASASRTAMWLPTAPAPKTQIRISPMFLFGRFDRTLLVERAVDEISQGYANSSPLRNGLRHEHHEHVLLRIDPERGAAG